MSAPTWWNAAVEFVQQNEHLIEAVVFVLGFAELLVFVSFFIPASALFLAIAALEGAAGNPLLPIVLAGTLGCFAGDMVSYAIGHRFKGDLKSNWLFVRWPKSLARTQSLFQSRGILTIFLSKFIGPLRPVVPFVAGAMHMPLMPFIGASAASSAFWAAAFLIPSYYGIKLLAG